MKIHLNSFIKLSFDKSINSVLLPNPVYTKSVVQRSNMALCQCRLQNCLPNAFFPCQHNENTETSKKNSAKLRITIQQNC